MKNVCFVISPIGKDDSETRKRSDKLLKHIIEPACTECGFNAVRVDQSNENFSLIDTIKNYLQNASLVIADMTDGNPNVFYEIGFRDALNLPIINMKEKNYSIPFDVAPKRTIDYCFDLDEAATARAKLVQIIQGISFDSVSGGNNDSDMLQALYNRLDDIESKIPVFEEISEADIDNILMDAVIDGGEF